MKNMHENLTDKNVIVDCQIGGKELICDGKFNALIINLTLLSIAMDELHDIKKPCLTQIRMIEHWWYRKMESIKWLTHNISIKYISYETITHPTHNKTEQ